MKLQYRGVSYNSQSTALEGTVKVQGKFRGQKWTSYRLSSPSAAERSDRLIYRGVVVQ